MSRLRADILHQSQSRRRSSHYQRTGRYSRVPARQRSGTGNSRPPGRLYRSRRDGRRSRRPRSAGRNLAHCYRDPIPLLPAQPLCLRRSRRTHDGSLFECRVADTCGLSAHDDVASARFMPRREISPELFGLESIRRGITRILERSK